MHMILGGWVDVGHDGRFGVAEVLNGGAIRKTWSVGRKGPKTYQVILKCLLK